MKRLNLCLLIALLVSCDQTENTGESQSVGESKPRNTRAKRPSRNEAPSRGRNFKEAIKEALEIEEPQAREQALAEIARNAFETVPEIASEALEHLPIESRERKKTIRYMAGYLVQKNPDEALAWAETLTSEQTIAMAKEQIGLALAATDPARGARVVLEHLNPTRNLNLNELRILQSWVSDAPADAAAWVVKLTPGEARKEAIEAVASSWMQVDPKAAFSWMAGSKSEIVREEVSRYMLETLVRTPPLERDSLLDLAEPTVRSELKERLNQITREAEKRISATPETP